eukprot:NODE_342_length_10579_cov_0.629389.p1 type:complete len:1031 gc:universal NODE_342_length_10579_cov_0.629389:5309-2217(-)
MLNVNSFNNTGQSDAGYHGTIFKDKSKQMQEVGQNIRDKGYLPAELVDAEVSWFYGHLGIDDQYFQHSAVSTIANHIVALYGSKITSYSSATTDQPLEIHLERYEEDYAVIISSSKPGVSTSTGPQVERTIDSKYLDSKQLYRLESFRSHGTVSQDNSTQVRCYFLKKCQFNKPSPNDIEQLDIRLVGDVIFLEKATDNTLELYQSCMREALTRTGPVIESFNIKGSREQRLVIAYKQESTTNFFSAMSDLYHYYDLYSTRKYVEQFSNGITIMSFYLNPLANIKIPIEQSIHQIIKEASLIYCLPITPLHKQFFTLNLLSVQETMYGHCAWIFCQHFLNRLGSEYKSLASVLTDPSHVEVLVNIKKRLRTDTFTREYILDIMSLYPELIKQLYIHFAMDHYVSAKEQTAHPTLSYQRINKQQIYSDDELLELIKKSTSNKHEFMVFECILQFNRHVLKTNFYTPTKVALSFRLDPMYLPDVEYPNRPYGIFMVVGTEFRGFHVRFRDIARGGIRIIKSRNKENYSINLRTLFDENYALALTQQKKNKDIPEGGSKGTILMDVLHQDKSKQAFMKYTDSILDLLLPGHTPGIKELLVDKLRVPEILFFGPDEGTADVMDWAALHAKKRDAGFWKAFTTGKSQSLGGIPHDLFGMTTKSVHQYVLGIYRKLGINEYTTTKLQTGGPDGDLGSNEIKTSLDITVGIVDGSGVLWDPMGLNRQELLRLANARLMSNNFDVKLLSEYGFYISVESKDVKLPPATVQQPTANGYTVVPVGSPIIVSSGLAFRNEFHLLQEYKFDLFVPCGGRPESIDLSNVGRLITNGKCKFKWMVEGANLFITQDARLRLEQSGCVIFKDASANKGGVTSSSMEVLAALSFDDAEYQKHMMGQKNGEMPAFYNDYIKQVHLKIEKNADLEFECLWREGELTNTPKSILSDKLSYAIVQLKEELVNSSLYENEGLRTTVLMEALPKLLIETVGLQKIMNRVPDPYMRAIFGTYLASRFVYKYGTSAKQFAFFEFIGPYLLGTKKQ